MNKITSENLPSYVLSYLKKYFIDHWEIECNSNKRFKNIVVIPAIKEYENILKLLNSISENESDYFDETLFLFVINNPESCNTEIINENKNTIELLRSIINKNLQSELAYKIYDNKINIGFVDASSKGYELPDKDAGVGLARKIGMDLALRIFDYNNPKKNILISLDADCLIAKNYLNKIVEAFNQKKVNAAVVYYEHLLPDNEEEKLAIIYYEIFLRYYILGLKYSNSHYAYHSIGSTIVCDTETYCKAGGMNKRKAGEDFYFLEKLAKITTINHINSTTVFPSSRSSWRVPFGTGKSISKYLNEKNEYKLYNPECFNILKQWLLIFHNKTIKDAQYYLAESEKIHFRLREFLELNSFETAWENILSNSKNDEQIQKQKLYWFDAFRTMKLIHYLRDTDFPPVNMFDAVDDLLKMMNYHFEINRNELIPDVNTQLKYLYCLRDICRQL